MRRWKDFGVLAEYGKLPKSRRRENWYNIFQEQDDLLEYYLHISHITFLTYYIIMHTRAKRRSFAEEKYSVTGVR